MGIALQVLQIIAPVIILAGIGVGWVKLGLEYRVQFVTRLTMSLSVPALIFVALVKTEIEPQALRDTALAALVTYIVVAAVIYALIKAVRLDLRTYLAPLTFGNTGNLGLPLALFAFGGAGLDYAVIVFAIMAVLSFTIGVWVVSGLGSPKAALKEPILWATLLGGVFLLQGWSLPSWGMNTLELLGQVAIPVMLITLGVAMVRLKAGSIKRSIWLAGVKYIICVTIAWGVGRLFALEPVALAVLILQVSTPVAVTSYMLAEKYAANSDQVAGLVMVSTLMSIAAIPLILAFLV
ncbi:MAG: AEC family transporter [Paracoccaceae bacterium]